MTHSPNKTALKANTPADAVTATARAAVERYVVLNDKGGIGKSFVVQGLSLEMAAVGKEHVVVEAETSPRLQNILGADRVKYHELSEDSLSAIRKNPDLLGEYWDNVIEDFMGGPAVMDLSANATKLLWQWCDGGVGKLVFGDGAGIGALVVVTADPEALRLAAEAMTRAATEWPAARLFLVVNPHHGDLAPNSPALDLICSQAGERAGEVVRVFLPRNVAKAWPVMVGSGKPLHELALLKPQALMGHGYKLGEAARSVADVIEWLEVWRPQVRRILEAGGTLTSEA
ncbi:hypothetical protein [Belnapia rosea]|uniref:CobQ/CobB/MinD/ParA nucleotide binding domain-containing protein n=1 Tax=Belnapia rosea TaxID=938405 RepID=A0A1G7BSP2_9PROT|nr:hypothetical protein [Belnapia rosea]SDE30164.1 hypothetical protein SAMN04487779_102712 [Belnapia rosea]